MTIKRSSIEIVDFSEGDEFSDDSIKSYCKHCEKFGFKIRLRNRIYPDNPEGEPIPPDHDQFRQCHECGLIVPVYELEKEASVKDVVETSDSPFDEAKDQFLGVDSRTSINGKKKSAIKKRQKELDHINDPDLKRELKKGSTLLSYSEQIP